MARAHRARLRCWSRRRHVASGEFQVLFDPRLHLPSLYFRRCLHASLLITPPDTLLTRQRPSRFQSYFVRRHRHGMTTHLDTWKRLSLWADRSSQSASMVTHITHETQLHLAYCEEFGLSREEVAAAEEGLGTRIIPIPIFPKQNTVASRGY